MTKIYLRLNVSDKTRELATTGKGSKQFSIPHDSVIDILSLCDYDGRQINKKNPLQLTCTTPKGTKFNLIQSSLHSIHIGHQNNVQTKKILDWAWDQVGELQFEVESVEQGILNRGLFEPHQEKNHE